MTGRQGKYTKLTCFIPVHIIFNALTTIQVSLFLPIYALTDCDTVSAFYWHGKKQAIRLLMKDSHELEQLSNLGDKFPISDDQKMAATKSVGHLYGES